MHAAVLTDRWSAWLARCELNSLRDSSRGGPWKQAADTVRDVDDRQRLADGREATVSRFGWEILSYVVMTNHVRAFSRVPAPNLSRGMPYWVSGYAKWNCRHIANPSLRRIIQEVLLAANVGPR